MTTKWDISLDAVIAKLERAKKFAEVNEAGVRDEAEALGQAMLARRLLNFWIGQMMDEGY